MTGLEKMTPEYRNLSSKIGIIVLMYKTWREGV